jgi:zinc protease
MLTIMNRLGGFLGRAVLIAAGSLTVMTVARPNAHAAEFGKHVARTKIAGIDVIAYRTDIKDVVTILGSLPAGDAMATDNIALATLTGIMLDKGTMSMDKFAIARQLDQVGAQLAFHVGEQTLTVQARSLKADLPLVLKVMADELRHPAFSSEEFAKAKLDFSGQIRQQAESTEYRAGEAFSRAVFPAGHPNRQSSLDEWHSAIDKADALQVKEFHQKFFGPTHMVLVLVGDLDIPKIQAELKKDFGGWHGGVAYRPAPAATMGAPVDTVVSLAGKTSVTVIAGQATGLRYRDADSLTLRVGIAILGSGFTSRLVGTVRDKEGLTYHIGAAMADDTFDDGDWRINASFAPTLLDKGIAETQHEVLKWWQEGVTAPELQAHKTDLIGSFQLSLATTGGIAGALLRTVQRGLPLNWLDDYPKSVNDVTLDQVNSAIKRYVDPAKLVIVKAGTLGGDGAIVQ